MKRLFILLFTFGILTAANAQPDNSSLKRQLLDLLKSKHDYERFLTIRREDSIAVHKAKYAKAFERIKENNYRVLLYINNSLAIDADALGKEYVFYEYENPVSSRRDHRNRMTLATYFKIVKYSLEKRNETLPRLRDVLLYME